MFNFLVFPLLPYNNVVFSVKWYPYNVKPQTPPQTSLLWSAVLWSTKNKSKSESFEITKGNSFVKDELLSSSCPEKFSFFSHVTWATFHEQTRQAPMTITKSRKKTGIDNHQWLQIYNFNWFSDTYRRIKSVHQI